MDNEQISLIAALWNSGYTTAQKINQADMNNFLLALETRNIDNVLDAWSAILTNPNNDINTDFIADIEVALDPELYQNQTLSAKA